MLGHVSDTSFRNSGSRSRRGPTSMSGGKSPCAAGWGSAYPEKSAFMMPGQTLRTHVSACRSDKEERAEAHIIPLPRRSASNPGNAFRAKRSN